MSSTLKGASLLHGLSWQGHLLATIMTVNMKGCSFLQMGCIENPWSVQMSNSSGKRDASRGPGSARKVSVVRDSSQRQNLLQEFKPLAAG